MTNLPEDANEKVKTVLTAIKNVGIDCSLCNISVGPTYTLIELNPTAVNQISKVRKRSEDIYLSLACLGVRIIAPVPGKGTIGIEIPNDKPQIIRLGTLLNSPEFTESKAVLPIAVGMDVEGKCEVADLTKMPHLLIGGASSQGKSVFLHSLIVSLLAAKEPDELQFLLIDPKMVEYYQYRTLANSYLLKVEGIAEPVISNSGDTKVALNALCAEMERRYSLLRNAGVRTIADYNDKESDKLPYIVVVIDEFAELIMTFGKDFETPIARLAQKARAAGIHVVLATQRPSKDVITGIIKANYPARIAFRVSQRVDSKTILDYEGANNLLGCGDMLFSNNGRVSRLQGAFIDNAELDKILNSLSNQNDGQNQKIEIKGIDMNESDTEPKQKDSLFDKAAKFFASQEFASITMLQRKFEIGFKRACQLMDELEAAGIVGPAQGAKPREILINSGRRSKSQYDMPKKKENVDFKPSLKRSQTFDTICTEAENSKEVSIARSFAQAGATSGVLVVFGNSGVGKTHIANAIGNKIKAENPSARVAFVAAHQFSDQLTEASKRSLSLFTAFYRSLDMLIVDDIQVLSSKPFNQEILLQIFDGLLQKNAKIVTVCDRHPSALADFDPKLISRLNSGIAIELPQAGRSLRFRIIEQQDKRLKGYLSSEILQRIADTDTSIFEMLGRHITLLAYKEASKGEINNSTEAKIPGERVAELAGGARRLIERWKDFILEAKSVYPAADTWLRMLHIKSFDDGELVVAAPSQNFVDQFEERFIASLSPILKAFWGENMRLSYVLPTNDKQ
ncbi:MAG: FtsK/SpoIIIE domain-containing protein [Muribaculaceae bacterium]|nr:FtsK/SpoIIIE domain-containing protein [Muribaculaceae bacterium]